MALKWAWGVTTVPSRRDDLLPQTLRSLHDSGFQKPRLFVDGLRDPEAFRVDLVGKHPWLEGLEVTSRWPTIRTYGNWILALAELYIREPDAERYALFQDDFICVRNLRSYLERCGYPAQGYLNLYTFPENSVLTPRHPRTGKPQLGWHPSNGKGLGAVALVFSKEAVLNLLYSQHMVNRPLDSGRGWRSVDGGVVTALKKVGWQEFVHHPSLVQHTGIKSAMKNRPHPQARTFPGESHDALLFLEDEGYAWLPR